jgi:microsomal dipeptidase-like Zn-dependent dipeptidase
VGKGTRLTWTQFLDLLDHVLKLVGVDHVGVGTDFSLWSREEYQARENANPNLLPQGPEDGWIWRNIFVKDQPDDDVDSQCGKEKELQFVDAKT